MYKNNFFIKQCVHSYKIIHHVSKNDDAEYRALENIIYNTIKASMS